MPLEGMPLIEPDASDLDIIMDSAFGHEEEEVPSLESGEELEEREPEIILDIDSDAQPIVSTVDAFPESSEEIEDAEELEDFLEPEDLGGMELHSEETDLGQLEELTSEDEASRGTLDDLDSLEPIDDNVSNPSIPLTYHPDELATSLDDSLFVEPAVSDGASFGEVEEELLPELDEELETVDLAEAEPELESIQPQEPVAEPEPEPEVATAETREVSNDAAGQTSSTVAMPNAGLSPAPAPDKLKNDVKSVLLYLDQLLASLPEEKIEEFASSEYYDTYKRLFDDLGLL